ncbi:hypothetical protein [Paraliobacillus sp. JSM ZJ581]|uniref:IS66 family insertion sequence element accessory protein TnpA n=1 Tax=Paraliobacillus sp. JSM ZJ581 TaxID=3342118 RepID=UPI0035A8B4F0
MTLKEKRIEWEAHYNAWKESGQSIAAWCGIKKSTFTKCIIGCSNLSVMIAQ